MMTSQNWRLALHAGPEVGRAVHVGRRLLRPASSRARRRPLRLDYAQRCAHTPAGTSRRVYHDRAGDITHYVEYIEREYHPSSCARYPQRIVCLTEETTETLYRLGRRRPRRRRVGLYGAAARGAAEAEGLGVHQRAVRQDRGARARPGARVLRSAGGHRRRADPARPHGRGVQSAERRRDPADDPHARRPRRAERIAPKRWPASSNAGSTRFARRRRGFRGGPRVFFEEWDDPLISGIRWVDELVEIAGGEPIFPAPAQRPHSRRTASSSPDAVRDAAPDVILASWCGKKVSKSRIAARPGWATDAGRPPRPDLRDQIDVHPAAGTGGADRRRAAGALRCCAT